MTTKEKFQKYMIPLAVKSVQPMVIAKANSATMVDTEGKQYIDCFAGIAVVNSGHNHPKVVAAAKEQMDKIVHACTYVYMTEPVANMAEKLAEITPPGLEQSFFSNSGAEAIEGAMRVAKQYTGKREFIALTNSFHGRTYATLSITGNYGRKKKSGPYMPGVAFVPAPYCYRCPLRMSYPSCGVACAEMTEEVILRHTTDDVAGFIAEAVLGEGGIVVPPAEYFKITSKITHNHGGLFIVDEVQSGFGRTGKMMGIDHYETDGVDIMTMAKGIAGGFPLSAFTTKPEIAAVLEPGDHLSTFGGNPISCAAGVANIEVLLKEGIIANAAARGDQALAAFRKLAEKSPYVGDVRGKGLMIGVELVKDKKTKEPADAATGKVRETLRERGVLVGKGGVYGNVLRFQPPLTITEAETAKAVELISAAVLELKL